MLPLLVLVRSVVTDGITIGHPCCSSYNCKIPLSNMKKRFCDQHSDLERQCCAKDCSASVSGGYQTCKQHRQVELSHFAAGKGMFQL